MKIWKKNIRSLTNLFFSYNFQGRRRFPILVTRTWILTTDEDEIPLWNDVLIPGDRTLIITHQFNHEVGGLQFNYFKMLIFQ